MTGAIPPMRPSTTGERAVAVWVLVIGLVSFGAWMLYLALTAKPGNTPAPTVMIIGVCSLAAALLVASACGWCDEAEGTSPGLVQGSTAIAIRTANHGYGPVGFRLHEYRPRPRMMLCLSAAARYIPR